MTLKNAEQFVEEMKNNPGLRETVSKNQNPESLAEILHRSGFDFNKSDLVKAMAGCMAAMDGDKSGAGSNGSNADIRMDEITQTLISIGAATAANCIPCLEHYYYRSGTLGLTDEMVQEAFEIGSKVKTGAALAIKGTLRGLLDGDMEPEQKECCTTASSCC